MNTYLFHKHNTKSGYLLHGMDWVICTADLAQHSIIGNDKREYSHFYNSPNSYKLINIFTVGELKRPPSIPFNVFYWNGQMLKHFQHSDTSIYNIVCLNAFAVSPNQSVLLCNDCNSLKWYTISLTMFCFTPKAKLMD
jgi:hypothetical protein